MTERTEKYIKIFNNVSDIIVLFDLEGNIVDINQTACDILGITKSNIIKNKPHFKILGPELFRDKVSETLENEISIFEHELIKDDKIIAQVEIILKLINIDNNQFILGVARNIKKRKRIEKALKDKISEQELLLDSLDFQIWYLVEPESYAAVNKARAEFLGYDKKDLISKNIHEFQTEKEATVCINWNKIAFEEKRQVLTEEWLKNADGEYRLCRINRTPKLDENNIVEYVICTLEDITELKRAEEEMKRRMKKIEILNKIIIAGNEAKDLINLLMIILSSTLELLNFEGGGIYLLSEDEIYANLICTMGLQENFVESVRKLKISDSPYNKIFFEMKSLFTDDYSKIHPNRSQSSGIASIASVPIIASEKAIGALNISSTSRYSFSADERNLLQFIGREMGNVISKLKAEERLKESEEQYRKAYNRADFYKNLFAHDINNILQNIKMSCALSINTINANGSQDDIKKFNLMAKEQINRAEKLVSNIRKISQLEEEKIPLKRIDVMAVLNNSIEYIKKGFQFKTTDINLNTSINKIFISGNELLQDVFENIMINSIKYNQSEKIIIDINVLRQRVDCKKFLIMEFIDNGIGIQDEMKKRIFEGGLNNHPGVKGMGLGLSLVKKVLENYNGKIKVEDKIQNDYSKGCKVINRK